MVALLNTQIDQEQLLPLLMVLHPATLPINGEPLIKRNCRILSEQGISDIYIVVSQRPEDVESLFSKDSSGAKIHFIVVNEEYSVNSLFSDMADVLGDECIYVPSQSVINESQIHSLLCKLVFFKNHEPAKGVPLRIRTSSRGIIQSASSSKFQLVHSLSDLKRVNHSEYEEQSLGVNAIVREGITLCDSSVSLGYGTSLYNTILMNGVKTNRLEDIHDSIVTQTHSLNLNSGEISERQNRSSRINLIRISDMICSGIGLFLLFPLFLLIAFVIKLDSKGPIFYHSKRVVSPSRNKWSVSQKSRDIPFSVFRTMYANADKMVESNKLDNRYENGPYKKFNNDCRVTKIGSFLRKTSLDELPLLWHVFTGDLSLVGTWALPVYEAESIENSSMIVNNINFTDIGQARFQGTAGISGLWQCGGRSNLPAEERAVLDAIQTAIESPLYKSKDMPNIRKSFKGYLSMIVTTVKSVIICKGAQ